ncbi:hypothetical protein [Roseomonas sp. WA12]
MAPTITNATLSDVLYASNGTALPSYFVLSGMVAPGHGVEIVDQAGQTIPFGRSYTSPSGNWSTEFSGFWGSFRGLHEYAARDTVTGELSALTAVLIASAPEQTLTGPTLGETLTGPTILIASPAMNRIPSRFSEPGGENTFVAYTVQPDEAGHHATGADVVIHGGYKSTVVLPVEIGELTGHHIYISQEFGRFDLALETADARVLVDQDVTTLRFNDVTVTVQKDPLVDFLYYDGRYADVAALDLNVRGHYDAYGWQDGRDPNALFSTQGYRGAYADVRQAGLNPLNHYDAFGWKEGRDPSAAFDTTLYLTFNPDVAQSGIDPLVHYLHFGIEEGRKTSPVVESTLVSGGFDPRYYLLANPDVGLAGMDAQAHYLAFGALEGRNPDAFFDTNWYLAQNPDVKASGIEGLAHYQATGWREGRDPSTHFGTSDYLAANPDVAAAGLSPLQHFLQFGIAEGRSAHGDLF